MLTLVFTTSSYWLSRTIRALTKSDVSHVAIGTELHGVPVLFHSALDDQNGRNGVQITTRERWLRTNRVITEYMIIPDVSSNLGTMVNLLGEKYDKLGLVGYMFVIIATWLGRFIKNPLSSPTGFLCPRYVLKLDPEGILIKEWKNVDPERTTPHDLLVLCRIGKNFERLIDVN